MNTSSRHLLAFCVALAITGTPAAADTVEYYVGIDNLPVLSSGVYTGLSNPNLGRLTLLFNHGDHFHGIGAYSYTGPASAPVVTSTSTNNHIPEVASAEAPLPLAPGSGIYDGRWVNQAGVSEYSDIQMNSVDALSSSLPGSPENILSNSSSGRWNSSLGATQVGLQLVVATPGLTIGNETTPDLFASSSSVLLGTGSSLSFMPTFSTSALAQPGNYSATLRLVDFTSSGASSGDFTFDFAVPQPVPEPATVAILSLGLTLVIAVSHRRRSHPSA